jgi:hypothetical protein
MAVVISLREVADALEEQDQESRAHLNTDTGEVQVIRHAETRLLEEGCDEESLPKWQLDLLHQTREFLASPNLLLLPDRFTIHEWQIMKDFADEQRSDRIRATLNDAIRGAGAFRQFKSAIYRSGIQDAWYRFRRAAIEEIARDWLEENHLTYK